MIDPFQRYSGYPIVRGSGPFSPYMLVGEAPGYQESIDGLPFVGKSGQEQDRLLDLYGLSSSLFYKTNVVKHYLENNPDPTAESIAHWTPVLIEETHRCQARVIVAVGRFAMRWFLGESAELDSCRGLPHKAGCFDPSRSNRAPIDCIIIPVTHPAAGMRPGSEKFKINIADDYFQMSELVHRVRANKPVKPREDEYEGKEIYLDVTGRELEQALEQFVWEEFSCSEFAPQSLLKFEIAIDTEGSPELPWSIQASWEPGTAYVLRYSQPDFQTGIAALQRAADAGALFITHCANTPQGGMYDVGISRTLGLDLSRARVLDTMYGLYLLRTESKGLKPAAYRFCNMTMTPYEETLGGVARDKQIRYLERIATREWPKPPTQYTKENDGTITTSNPWPLHKTVTRALKDIYSGKVTKEGPTDPHDRWHKIPEFIRAEAEKIFGLMPDATLDDIPLSEAIYYAARDADATLRLRHRLASALSTLDIRDARLRARFKLPIEPSQSTVEMWSDSTDVLPVIEQMQYNGMPGSRPHFQALYNEVDSVCDRLQYQLSQDYFRGQPFNPGSSDQCGVLLDITGLKPAKRTPKGAPSTAKKSIEHLRYKHPAMTLMFDWREHQHIRDSFCAAYLREIPPGAIIKDVHGNIKPAHTETRRLSMEDPNLLNVPSHTEIGRKVRACFRCDDGYIFAGYDLSQIELRVLAHDSQSPFLCRQFINGADLHSATAEQIFKVTPESVGKDVFKTNYRLPAKTINFMLVYGAEGGGIYDKFRSLGLEGWDPDSCGKLKKEVFKLFEINDYVRSMSRMARQLGYMRDYFGMYRFLPNIDCGDFKLEAEAERHALSQRIQGTAQGMIQKAMKHLRRPVEQLQDCKIDIKWRLQIHDELIFTMPERHEPIITPIVLDALTNHSGIKLKVPVLAEAHFAQSWDEAK